MTSVYIASAIIVLLIVMVCYAFMVQTVAKKREQQQRLIYALEQRIKNFRNLLSGFPEGFLPHELNLLVYRHLVDTAQQLTALKPKEKRYIEELGLFSRELSDVQRKPPSQQRVRLESPKQGKEVKHYLTELNKFLHRLHKRGTLSDTELDAHQAQIRQLVLHITVDNYVDHAQSAETAEKPKMALHYYTLARNLLSKEKLSKNYKGQINELDRHIIRLEGSITPEENVTPITEPKKNNWEEFGDEASWKKKAIYD